MGGLKDQEWIRASDDVVRERLAAEFQRAQAAASPNEVLGVAGEEEFRPVFLSLTKSYHPNRFARRPDDIRRLASEVFMLLKKAYEQANQEANANRLTQARARKPTQAPPRERSASRPVESAARQEMMERRRAQLKNRLGGGNADGGATGKRTAQIRAATGTTTMINPNAEAEKRAEEETRFERAQNLMRRNDFAAAAAAFKELAVGRPADKKYRMHMHYAQGRVRQAMGQTDEARAEYKRALGLDADFSPAHQAMSSLPSENKKKNILNKIFGK